MVNTNETPKTSASWPLIEAASESRNLLTRLLNGDRPAVREIELAIRNTTDAMEAARKGTRQ